MSNSEIYDPSNSDLSSDEYATEEDDDALMDAAVCKQPPPPPPKETKSSLESSSMPETASASTKPSSSSVELPPTPPPNDKGTKPPATREETLRRIRQIRARKENILYYKRRSVRWLRKLQQFPDSKLDALKQVLPIYKAHYKRLSDYWSDRAAYRQKLRARQSSSSSSRSRSYSPSRSNSRSRSRFRSRSGSRSRSESNSPELICLDDTENEDSPEKVEPAQTARQMTPVREDKEKSIPLRQVDFDKKPPPLAPENGSVLDEFLTMKPPINQILKQQVDKEITAYEMAQFSAAMKQLTENTQQQPKEEAHTTVAPTEPLKRRRSVTPPPLTSSQDKRPRQMPDPDDDDDDRIEFIPVVQPAQEPPNRALVTQQQYLQPQMQRPQHPPVQEKPQQQQLQQPLKDKPQQQPQQQPQQPPQQPQQQQPPQIQMQIQKRKPQHPQQHHPPQPQVPQPHPQPLQHKPQKFQPDPRLQHPQPQHPHPQNQQPQHQQPQHQPQQTLQQKALQDPRFPGFQLGTPYSLAPVAGSGSGAIQQAVNLTAMAYSLNTPSPQAVPMEISYPTAKLPQTAANPMNLQMPTQAHQPRAPPPASPQPQTQPQPQIQPQAQTFAVPQQPKPRRSETVSTQTPKTAQAPQPAAQNQIPSTAQNPPLGRPKPPPMDLGNDDANFHYHLLSLYEEMDTQLKAKISLVKPELKALARERERIEFEMKNLDRQILKHEDEGNRLQYLRLVQNELRIRLERKERLAIIKSMVPNLIGQNCSISELNEMQAMLALNSEDAAAVSMERCLNKMEQNRSNIEMLRSALGLKAPEREPTASPTLPRLIEEFSQRGRSSLPPLRGSTHDVNNLFDSRRHSEERPAPSSNLGHISSQTQNSQRLPKSPSLEFLAGRQGLVQAQVQTPPHHRSQSSLHCPSGIENLIMPLYNSSPLASQQRKHDEMHSNYNNESYSSGGQQQQPQTNPQPQGIAKTFDNRSNRLQTSGPGEGVIMMNGQGGEHNCMECGKNQANFICGSCKMQCYCSRECQLRAWDAHYPLCGQ